MDSRIKQIAEHYGYEAQSRQCMEECAELIQAINKLWREERIGKTGGASYRVKRSLAIEEIADVQIMLWQMEHMLGIEIWDLAPITEQKLERQMQRIKEENA